MLDLTGKVDSAGPPTGQLTAAEWNSFLQDVKNLLTRASITASGADLEQLAKSVAQISGIGDYYTGGGTANAQTLTASTSMGAVAYVTGLRVRWKPTATNTGAATIAVNGLAAKTIQRVDGTVLQAGDITTGRYAEAVYDGTVFKLMNWALSAPAQALPSGYITGLSFTPPVADLTHDITVSTGQARDILNTVNLVLSTSLTKRFDGASIAYGTGQTGFPTISLTRTVSTWYRVFLVGHVDGRVDVGFDTDAAAINLMNDLDTVDSAGWTYYRQLGWVRTQAADATAFVPFVQYGARPGRVHWIDGNQLFDEAGLLVTTRTTRNLSALVPPLCVAHIHVLVEPPSGAAASRRNLLLTDTNQADYAPSSTRFTLTTKSAGGPGNNSWVPIGVAQVRVDSSSQVYERWDAASSWERSFLIPCWDFGR